jgi:hypothetical protein
VRAQQQGRIARCHAEMCTVLARQSLRQTCVNANSALCTASTACAATAYDAYIKEQLQ